MPDFIFEWIALNPYTAIIAGVFYAGFFALAISIELLREGL